MAERFAPLESDEEDESIFELNEVLPSPNQKPVVSLDLVPKEI